jgi:hypothetical protein
MMKSDSARYEYYQYLPDEPRLFRRNGRKNANIMLDCYVAELGHNRHIPLRIISIYS